MTYPNYFESFDYAQMRRDFPLGADFSDDFAKRSRDEIRAHQDRLFRRCVHRPWEIPFYRAFRGGQGVTAHGCRGLHGRSSIHT